MSEHLVEWLDSGKEPQCGADPAYPSGIDLDLSDGRLTVCFIDLPYPARRIGVYLVSCELCGLKVSCTTAGRADDPRSIKLGCRL
jgi:hypothetical protein